MRIARAKLFQKKKSFLLVRQQQRSSSISALASVLVIFYFVFFFSFHFCIFFFRCFLFGACALDKQQMINSIAQSPEREGEEGRREGG